MKPPPTLKQVTWLSCNNGSCVEVAEHADLVWVRGTKDAEDVLSFTRAEWRSFIEVAKRGHFDV